jgi:hypothetical protein
MIENRFWRRFPDDLCEVIFRSVVSELNRRMLEHEGAADEPLAELVI